jgi:predicted secreted hydrolase
MKTRLVFLLLIIGAVSAVAAETPEWRAAAPGYAWSFPRDFSVHPDYKTEWWYITGHLDPLDGGPALGFQLTFFRVGLERDADATDSDWAAGDLVMAHAAVTDPAAGTHAFSEAVWRAVPLLGGFGAPGDTTLAWCRAPAGTPGTWTLDYVDGSLRLRARDDRRGLRYELTCTPRRAPVFHGEGGFSPKTGDGSAGSLYFSQTRMAVEGAVYRDGAPLAVTGDAWLDREVFTSTLAADQTGWDWFALQLEDGRDLMVYRLRRADGSTDFALGTLVAPDGSTTPLPAEAWTLTPGKTWSSPDTESEYPVAWKLSVPGAGLELELKAVLPDQENVSPRTGIHYWEGVVDVRQEGRTVGPGFVELTGYGEGSRPPV